jgi:hypothetical protein
MVANRVALDETDSTEQCKIGLLVYFVSDELLVTQSLVSDAGSEKFAEVKAMFS